MKKEKVIYQALFRKITALKVALVVFSVMIINMPNLPVLATVHSPMEASKYVMQIENKIGKIYSMLNLPVHIVNELLKKDIAVSDGGTSQEQSNGSFSYSLFEPVKKTSKKSAEMSLLGTISKYGGHSGKFLSKNGMLIYEASAEYGSCNPNYPESNDIIRFILLFLILLLVLPRGVPDRIKKNINIKVAFPVFVLNKAGIFHFMMECKRSVK